MENERLSKLVVERARAEEEKTYIVIPELKFTDAMLNDVEPLPSMTYRQMFDLFVESGEIIQENHEAI
jgi:hypothetical protein